LVIAYDLFWLYRKGYLGYAVGSIFLIYYRIYFGYSLGFSGYQLGFLWDKA